MFLMPSYQALAYAFNYLGFIAISKTLYWPRHHAAWVTFSWPCHWPRHEFCFEVSADGQSAAAVGCDAKCLTGLCRQSPPRRLAYAITVPYFTRPGHTAATAVKYQAEYFITIAFDNTRRSLQNKIFTTWLIDDIDFTNA
jgi:hypothetical protein